MISSLNLRKSSPNTGVLWKNNNCFIFEKTAWFKFPSLFTDMPRANFINADLDFVLGDFG